MSHFRDLLPFTAWPGYLWWHYAQAKPFRCSLQAGPDISIRPRPSHDYQTACEIFSSRIYDCDIDPNSVRVIVDLGGNVGYSCLYWCEKYPNASVLAFEPHPAHCQLLEWHVNRNGFNSRVELVAAAAGVSEGIANLTDNDDGSTIVQGTAGAIIEVPVVDVFKSIPDSRIDILKMDIEGSEYPILADPRFDRLAERTRFLMIEWHARGEFGEAFCRDRLESLGFKVSSGRDCDQRCGMLYCSRV